MVFRCRRGRWAAALALGIAGCMAGFLVARDLFTTPKQDVSRALSARGESAQDVGML
jgi:hypothetical protein